MAKRASQPITKAQNQNISQFTCESLKQEEVNFLLNSHKSREENIFQFRILLMQQIEKGPLPQNEIRDMLQIVQNQEKYRSKIEEQIIKRVKQSQNISLTNTSSKNQLYKMCSKLCKVNQMFLTKIQTYFPRMYEVISQEQYQLNNSFKDELFSTLNSNNGQVTKVLQFIFQKMKQKVQKEQNKLLQYTVHFPMLMDKSSSRTDKSNKNEKFYTEKLLCGVNGFKYIANILRKFFLRVDNNQIYEISLNHLKSNNNSSKDNEENNNNTQQKTIKNSKRIYEVMNLDPNQDKIPVFQSYKSCESLIEVVIQYYEKYQKECYQGNRLIKNRLNQYYNQYQVYNAKQIKANATQFKIKPVSPNKNIFQARLSIQPPATNSGHFHGHSNKNIRQNKIINHTQQLNNIKQDNENNENNESIDQSQGNNSNSHNNTNIGNGITLKQSQSTKYVKQHYQTFNNNSNNNQNYYGYFQESSTSRNQSQNNKNQNNQFSNLSQLSTQRFNQQQLQFQKQQQQQNQQEMQQLEQTGENNQIDLQNNTYQIQPSQQQAIENLIQSKQNQIKLLNSHKRNYISQLTLPANMYQQKQQQLQQQKVQQNQKYQSKKRLQQQQEIQQKQQSNFQSHQISLDNQNNLDAENQAQSQTQINIIQPQIQQPIENNELQGNVQSQLLRFQQQYQNQQQQKNQQQQQQVSNLQYPMFKINKSGKQKLSLNNINSMSVNYKDGIGSVNLNSQLQQNKTTNSQINTSYTEDGNSNSNVNSNNITQTDLLMQKSSSSNQQKHKQEEQLGYQRFGRSTTNSKNQNQQLLSSQIHNSNTLNNKQQQQQLNLNQNQYQNISQLQTQQFQQMQPSELLFLKKYNGSLHNNSNNDQQLQQQQQLLLQLQQSDNFQSPKSIFQQNNNSNSLSKNGLKQSSYNNLPDSNSHGKNQNNGFTSNLFQQSQQILQQQSQKSFQKQQKHGQRQFQSVSSLSGAEQWNIQQTQKQLQQQNQENAYGQGKHKNKKINGGQFQSSRNLYNTTNNGNNIGVSSSMQFLGSQKNLPLSPQPHQQKSSTQNTQQQQQFQLKKYPFYQVGKYQYESNYKGSANNLENMLNSDNNRNHTVMNNNTNNLSTVQENQNQTMNSNSKVNMNINSNINNNMNSQSNQNNMTNNLKANIINNNNINNKNSIRVSLSQNKLNDGKQLSKNGQGALRHLVLKGGVNKIGSLDQKNGYLTEGQEISQKQ